MRDDIIQTVTEELLTISPLIFRSIRRNISKTLAHDINMDISPLHIEIMKLLEGNGTLSITEIGEKLQIARAQMTHLIDRLAYLEIVERQTEKVDRRIIKITLTEKGRTTLKEQETSIREAFKEFLNQFTEDELKDISDSLNKLKYVFSKTI
jgi:DNA-binding MarR family transcriptional regulator